METIDTRDGWVTLGYSIASANPAIRWSKDGKLQQNWCITDYDGKGKATGQRHEWRDVPTETATDQ